MILFGFLFVCFTSLADQRGAPLQIQMWKQIPQHTAGQIPSGIGRPLAQRPAGGQLQLPETDSRPAAPSFHQPGRAVPNDALPWRFTVCSSTSGLRSRFEPGLTSFHWLSGGPGAQQGANCSGWWSRVDRIRKQEGVWGVSVLQQSRRLWQWTMSEWRRLPGECCWRWVNEPGFS